MTRSHIARENKDGSFDVIYVDWNGHLEHNGAILFQHYTSPMTVNRLLHLGNLSSLGPEIGHKHKFHKEEDVMCTAYFRDCEESWEKHAPAKCKDQADLIGMLTTVGTDLVYVFKPDDKWYYTTQFVQKKNPRKKQDLAGLHLKLLTKSVCGLRRLLVKQPSFG